MLTMKVAVLKVDQTAFIITSIDNHSRACIGVFDPGRTSIMGGQYFVSLESARILLRSLPSLVSAGLRFAASRSGKSLQAVKIISTMLSCSVAINRLKFVSVDVLSATCICSYLISLMPPGRKLLQCSLICMPKCSDWALYVLRAFTVFILFSPVFEKV